MRDLETMEAALKLAETGHLTLATLHTNSAAQTRHPHHRRLPGAPAGADPHAALARARGHRVSGAAAQGGRQGPRGGARDSRARLPAIRNLIRDDKIHQIYGAMQAGQEQPTGMQTMNQSLARLVERRLVTRDVALATSSNRDELDHADRAAACPQVAANAHRGARASCRRSDDDVCLRGPDARRTNRPGRARRRFAARRWPPRCGGNRSS